MKYNPPVNERKTKELLNIISNDEKWAKKIQVEAEQELYRRNYTPQTLETEKQKRLNLLEHLQERKNKNFEKNKIESYSFFEMVTIIIFFPFSFIFQLNPLTEFWKLKTGNYKKKIWQRIILIATSLLFWLLLFSKL